VLDRLRETFLANKPAVSSYWTTRDVLANYDFTYAQRIGWKWDAVLRELKLRGWSPPPGPLLDWGCGSGIASRRALEFFGPKSFAELALFDASALAMEFAREKAEATFPGFSVQTGLAPTTGTLIISHVLNELDETGGRELRRAIDGAGAVLWVEPGTFADSRALIAMREALREPFEVIAPCTHQCPCGMLAAGNEGHWCHHFATPPAGIMADSNWVRFAQRAGIDLRSIPYSFLVLERRGLREPSPGRLPEGCARVIGAARVYKGFARVLSCDAAGVRELELQKREAPAIHKAFKNETATSLWRWTVEGGRISRPKAVVS
jgi:SAM-dependent methyltransferase